MNIALKLSYFWTKMYNFQALQTPCLRRLGTLPPDPQNIPLNCEFLATRLPHFALFIIIWVFVAFVLNNFSSTFSCNLMMLTIIDVCLMPNCFLLEKLCLHYTLCDFDFILLHCTRLLIRQSIDHEQIFDVTFQPPPH